MTAQVNPPRPNLRADARENHARIIAAAMEIFAEQGFEATIPAIAARAGVGKATVYRSYPTKDDLINAIAHLHIERMVPLLRGALDSDDAVGSLHALIRQLFGQLHRNRALIAVLAETPTWREAFGDNPLQLILERGMEQGTIREDVSSDDVRTLLIGVTRELSERGEKRSEVWLRYADLVINAITTQMVSVQPMP